MIFFVYCLFYCIEEWKEINERKVGRGHPSGNRAVIFAVIVHEVYIKIILSCFYETVIRKNNVL